jgi:AmmeMemoRadiSam system protein B
MPGPRDQFAGEANPSVRNPAVAGMFYPADASSCRLATAQLFDIARQFMAKAPARPLAGADSAGGDTGGTSARAPVQPPLGTGMGAIVPHAGWICSGAIAAESILALAQQRPSVDVVVVFGAIHTAIPVDRAVFDSHSRWAMPSGEATITDDLRRELSGASAQFITDDRFHAREHAVEVELPLIQSAWPGARILPVEVPPEMSAVEIGTSVARVIARSGLSVIYLASSDLTHYGRNYGFAPAGIGQQAMAWALENDRRILRVVTDMTPEKIVPEVRISHNACGAGAIAAMMAACLDQGARKAIVLRHANSYQTLAAVAPQSPDNAVGYAAVWVG